MPPNVNEYIPRQNTSNRCEGYDALNNTDSRISFFLVGEAEETIPMSATSLKNKDGVKVTRVHRNEKPLDNGNTSVEPSALQSDDNNVPTTRYSSVKVQRVNRILKLDEKNASQNSESPLPSQSPLNISRVSVIKVPRNKMPRARSVDANLHELNEQRHSNVIYPNTRNDVTKAEKIGDGLLKKVNFDLTTKQRPRAASDGTISVIKVKRPAVQVRPIRNNRQASSSAVVNKSNANSRVNVTKVPRQQSKT
ncbi:unnamed protein product [Rotaria sp. Silwood1]|nr:unnamed protein product [Rotaria sp. Silwood1]